jgi:hypothetical protein
MARVKQFGENEFGITCLACGCGHMLKGWTFNGDLERPTFTPSLLVTGYLNADNPNGICHSFITDGQIRYLADSTHRLAGQTVDLGEYGEYDDE